jgi:glycosyltransferase involved in cell wall biosynthesis
MDNMNIGILWAQFGPYHFARVSALQSLAGTHGVCALELANRTQDYQWTRTRTPVNLVTLCPGATTERLSFSTVFRNARAALRRLGIDVCLLPSYSPRQSFAALLAAKSLGIRTVMMNESHAGTARATGLSAFIKSSLVRLFDTALVGGRPHRRYFASLGMSEEKIFTGYDAIDNDYFVRRSDEVRARSAEVRSRYGLPQRYFLSLGRFVAKKNLATLLIAYRKFLDSIPDSTTHLVMVGSGQEGAKLHALCRELRLTVYEKSNAENPQSNSGEPPGVHFYGFRQIEENPIFYALAEAFVLPSVYEEWGLVVNEAMASGLPVVVSETAGCAEDLLPTGLPSELDSVPAVSRIRQAGLRKKIRRNGFVFDPKSSDELANALRLLSNFSKMRTAMGRSSRSIVENFSCENFGRQALLAARAAMGQWRPCEEPSGHAEPVLPRN